MNGESVLGFIFALLGGLCAGSFINTCVYRVPRGLSIIAPRSGCPWCGEALSAAELIPLWSYIRLGGRCSRCGEAISRTYPIIEAVSGALAMAAFWAHGYSAEFFRVFGLSCVFLAIVAVDLRHLIVPDGFVAAGLAIAFAGAHWSGRIDLTGAGYGLAAGWTGFALLREAYRRLRGREGMGGGDVKLSALMGAALGIPGWLNAVMLGSIGGVCAGLVLIRAGRATSQTHLPFGTYLSAAAIWVLIFGGPR